MTDTDDPNPAFPLASLHDGIIRDCEVSRASAPFEAGDHVYQWVKVLGVPAFHHHGIVMQVYWDAYGGGEDDDGDDNGEWMLQISDFSNISLHDAELQRRRMRGVNDDEDTNPMFMEQDDGRFSSSSGPSSILSTFFGSDASGGSNPSFNSSARGTWRSYASPAKGWNRVQYHATFWDKCKSPSAGTCTSAVCDPPALVQARVRFLQQHADTMLCGDGMPYHWVHNNCEAVAVWAKTGTFCTLQALSVLAAAAAGQAKSTAVLAATTAVATQTVVAPAAGLWGWLGYTTTTQVPLLVSQPYIIPLLATYGVVTVGLPAVMMLRAKWEWKRVTDRLNDTFWGSYALEQPEIFVECIQHSHNCSECDTVAMSGQEDLAGLQDGETSFMESTRTGRRQSRPFGMPSQPSNLLVLVVLLLCSLCSPTFAQQQQDPRTVNGGSLLAMAGKECVALAVDKRFGSGSQMVNVAPRHIWSPHPNSMLAFVGFEADVQTLSQELKMQVASKRNRALGFGTELAGRRISPPALAYLTSHVLYEKRGYFVEPLVVGLMEKTHQPFLCAMDMIGAQSFSKFFVCSGAASKSLYGTAEALWRKDLGPRALAEVCGKAFQSALERDCLSGYGILVYLITKDGIVEYDLASRND